MIVEIWFKDNNWENSLVLINDYYKNILLAYFQEYVYCILVYCILNPTSFMFHCGVLMEFWSQRNWAIELKIVFQRYYNGICVGIDLEWFALINFIFKLVIIATDCDLEIADSGFRTKNKANTVKSRFTAEGKVINYNNM